MIWKSGQFRFDSFQTLEIVRIILYWRACNWMTAMSPTTTGERAEAASPDAGHGTNTAVFSADCSKSTTAITPSLWCTTRTTSSVHSRLGLRFQVCRHENRNRIERIFRTIKRRYYLLSNTFRDTPLATADARLQAFAVRHSRTNSTRTSERDRHDYTVVAA